ncbi:4-hydroxy-tetrahydrodipicolinate synthase [Burkholderia oklahomensis]|uniref:4-hydroxy-tetrahydrodipicolinate synthase n=1 Tax=Burkholderia oklahomensis TaxID=342113 RepID=A0AAI8B479_9BURK|nr:4-hydroxy-tetrahydrodipicolinate synthase [Burkholderia oklahomensis]AIO65368.1 dihydrodipicolinate synthase [Burkholderia oklahomensis]AOI41932.1 4-hydroxy-tetrahydrodipicolinate synthase [Burkholderia oklahomensis EO147]KUY49634.1 4-hydroxy-tetrahydrodipicolinate synthase [Burkholderia oklahomensis EO147]QPS36671.1 4-hydroxy-tetrahydrodipicolinate synthase [Burkholderia oklahomensis]
MANGTQDGIQIRGSVPAIVTPMLEDGGLDLAAFRKLIDWHIEEGTDALVVVGTSGESATLSVDEHVLMIETAVKHAAKRIPIVAGAGGNSTAEAIELSKHAQAVGADATLQVVPYYNKPTQEGMYRHFKAIAEAVDLPVILYNVPGRTVADMSNETILRLAQVPGIIGVKDATGNIDRAAQLIKAAPAQFSIYSGDDPTAIALMLLGGHGNISVTANVAPRAMSELCRAALAADAKTAREIHMKLLALHKNLFIEANPIPVKWALQQMGKIAGGIRLPLTPLDERCHEAVRSALREAGLL